MFRRPLGRPGPTDARPPGASPAAHRCDRGGHGSGAELCAGWLPAPRFRHGRRAARGQRRHGGPACARRHHAALAAIAVDWEDGEWRRRSGGSGRELVWFPEPVGGADCYRASLADPLLLVPAFPGCRRVTSRMEATRRDRLTSWLPMLRPPHPEGLAGAVRVEVRGWLEGRVKTKILGVAIPPAVAAGAVAARAALWAGAGRLSRHGAAGLAELVDAPGVFLSELTPAGVTVTAFEGGDPQD